MAASGMRQSDTRIPDRPDQRRFLDAWYDWQRGFRIVRGGDGIEERQGLTGGNLADCAPGHLPREASGMFEEDSQIIENTLTDNEGTMTLEIDPEDRIFDPDPLATVNQNDVDPNHSGHNSSEESTLEELRRNLVNARRAEEESQQALSEIQDLQFQIRHQLIRTEEAATETMERELTTLETRRQTVRRLERMLRRLTRGDQAARVFGTREDVEQADFISPITTFFQRHYRRHQEQEEERWQRPRSQNNHAELQERTSTPEAQEVQSTAGSLLAGTSEDSNTIAESSIHELLDRITAVPEASTSGDGSRYTLQYPRRRRRKRKPPILLAKGSRPEPLTDGQMQMNMKCNVCFEQLANIVLIPCGKHLVVTHV